MMISQNGISYPLPTSTTSINGFVPHNNYLNPNPKPNPNPENNSSGNKRKRTPGNPDPDAEVVALSPRSLMATNRFICEVCNKGFKREQNLQLHRRGHNLPWKLKQKVNKDQVKKKVYTCPEKSCVHHDPSRALGDLTGIKKHFSRKHGEKKLKCDKCSKKYAVMSDWKAHSKICGTREYKCDCGTIFSRKDSFITHRAFCDALSDERMRLTSNLNAAAMNTNFKPGLINSSPFSTSHRPDFMSFKSSFGATNNIVDGPNKPTLPLWLDHHQAGPQAMSNHIDPSIPTGNLNLFSQGATPKDEDENENSNYPQSSISLYLSQTPLPPSSSAVCSMSATALLQKAAQLGSTRSDSSSTAFASEFAAVNSQVAAEHGYWMEDQLAMMGAARTDSYNVSNISVGMRDFLGSVGGAGNSDSNGCWAS